jgi:hypothetical protein
MKDVLEFPVVGTNYIDGAALTVSLLHEGAPVQLVPEPTNQFDSNAIKVMAFANSEHIGYVPNKGMSCSHCWTPITLKETGCPSCGAGWDFVVEGGLATRLLKTKVLEGNYGAYVKAITVGERFSPVRVKLILE